MAFILGVLLTIAAFGLATYSIIQIPMPQVFRNVIVAVAILLVVLWLLHAIGFVDLPVLRFR